MAAAPFAIRARRPVLATVCVGRCAGRGRTLVGAEDPDPLFRMLWFEAEQRCTSGDGLHSVRCPTCAGTGRVLKF